MALNSKNFGCAEKSLENKMEALFGTRVLRKNGELRFVFCKCCEVSNDEICFYEQMRRYKDVSANTKYPCGKAYLKYKEQLKQGKK